MKKNLKILICFLLLLVSANSLILAQGFDWQYSARLPFKYPYFFGGLAVDAGYLSNYGNINLQEIEKGGTYDCCNFANGKGLKTTIGISSEFWYTGELAFQGKLTYSSLSSSFISDGVSLPRIIVKDTVHFSNELKSTLKYLSLEIGGKHRLFNSHFSLGVSLETAFLVANNLSQTEKVVSPDYWTYSDGSQQRTISRGQISGISIINLIPKIKLNYDFNIGLGMYFTPEINLGLPLINVASKADWRTWQFNFSISILRGLLYK